MGWKYPTTQEPLAIIQDPEFAQQTIECVNERRSSLTGYAYQNPPGDWTSWWPLTYYDQYQYPVTVHEGDYLQFAGQPPYVYSFDPGYWNLWMIQSWLALGIDDEIGGNLMDGFVECKSYEGLDAIEPFYTRGWAAFWALVAEITGVPGQTGWRRLTTLTQEPVTTWLFGMARGGDIMGQWLADDIRAVCAVLRMHPWGHTYRQHDEPPYYHYGNFGTASGIDVTQPPVWATAAERGTQDWIDGGMPQTKNQFGAEIVGVSAGTAGLYPGDSTPEFDAVAASSTEEFIGVNIFTGIGHPGSETWSHAAAWWIACSKPGKPEGWPGGDPGVDGGEWAYWPYGADVHEYEDLFHQFSGGGGVTATEVSVEVGEAQLLLQNPPRIQWCASPGGPGHNANCSVRGYAQKELKLLLDWSGGYRYVDY